MMNETISTAVVVGGGTAGWMTACYLVNVLQGRVRVTVVEEPSPAAGNCGEATPPGFQHVFCDPIAAPEEAWTRRCRASLAAGVRFTNWSQRTSVGRDDGFYHPFATLPTCDGMPLWQYWAARRRAGDDVPFDYTCFKEPPMMDAKLSPRYHDGRNATTFAWHCDESLWTDYLRALALGRKEVTHVVGTVVDVLLDSRGYISAIETGDGRSISGDLFVDCSGGRGMLIRERLGEPFVDERCRFLCDSLVATEVRRDCAQHGVEPYASAIAMHGGWAWKSPLFGGFGTGHVFASAFTPVDEAARELCQLWQLDERKVQLRHARFRTGRSERSWVKNCVAVGPSSCCVEPFESTRMYLICTALIHLIRCFPDRHFNPRLTGAFNRAIAAEFDQVCDFIQAHYAAATRCDTSFWRASKHTVTQSDRVRNALDAYRAGIVLEDVAARTGGNCWTSGAEFAVRWTPVSYHNVFAGLGVVPERPAPLLLYRPGSRRKAIALFADVSRQQAHLIQTLPTLSRFLQRFHGPVGETVDVQQPASRWMTDEDRGSVGAAVLATRRAGR